MPEPESTALEERKQHLLTFLKTHKQPLITYTLLFIILFTGVFIRTQTLDNLKDATTNEYIPLELDPFVMLRYARTIVEDGTLYETDFMRNYPLGVPMNTLGNFLPYAVAYTYNLVSTFIPSLTLEHYHILFPVICFVLLSLFFFLLTRQLTNTPTALLSTALLTVVPAFLFRTSAGFTDKEPIALVLWYAAFYFYLHTQQKTLTTRATITYAGISGILTGLAGLAWGGSSFILMIFAAYNLILLLFGRLTKQDFTAYLAWFIPTLIFLGFVTGRYGGIRVFFTSFNFGIATVVLFFAILHYLLENTHYVQTKIAPRFPTPLFTFIISVLLVGIISTIFFGFSLIARLFREFTSNLLTTNLNRWALTVGENNQPHFSTYYNHFGGTASFILPNIPLGKLYILLFFLGTILIFWHYVAPLTKHKKLLTTAFSIFLFAFTLSKYSDASILNGDNTISKTLYVGSFLFLVLGFLFYYLYTFYTDKEEHHRFVKLSKHYIFLFLWILFMIVAARRAIRFLTIFAPITTISVAFFLTSLLNASKKFNKKILSRTLLTIGVLLIILILFPFTKIAYSTTSNTGPNYTPQWQHAMNWVRNNTPEDAVFAHWWDYGYWVQEGGQRATLTDGGNPIIYWNYLLGRHLITAHSEQEALEYLYAHNATHFLLISDEIGKYPAFSIIASDLEYDRYSWLNTFVLDPRQTTETREATVYAHLGGYALDQDFIYNNVVFPANSAGIGAFLIPIIQREDSFNLLQPEAILVYNNQQYRVPLQCIYLSGQLVNFDVQGLPGCLRVIPSIYNNQINNIGASIYVSERVKKTLFADLFLFDKTYNNFKLVYDDSQNYPLALYHGVLIGPLKIWEITYPENITFKPEYLERDYPDPRLALRKT